MGELAKMMEKGFTGLKSDIAEIKHEFKSDIAQLKHEFKSDIAELKHEFKLDNTALTSEFKLLKSDFGGLKSDFGELKSDFATFKSDFAKLNTGFNVEKWKVGALLAGTSFVSSLLYEIYLIGIASHVSSCRTCESDHL